MHLNNIHRVLIGIFFISLLTACVSGHCRKNRDSKGAPVAEKTIRVKVYKYDGTLQCGMGKLIPLDDMKRELGSIPVHSAENKADGLMHITMCGSITGTANIYEIDKENLEKAKKLGFKEWTFDSK
ncbi:MAG: hypothetical protein AB7H97_01270 [Pseudobdellovibrionaceae bacterium]